MEDRLQNKEEKIIRVHQSLDSKVLNLIYDCEKCDHKSATQNLLRLHTKNVHEKNFVFEQCNLSTGTRANLVTHINAVHEKRKSTNVTRAILIQVTNIS